MKMNADKEEIPIGYLRLCSRHPWRSPSLALGPASLCSAVQFLLQAKLSLLSTAFICVPKFLHNHDETA
jgi:hypothetical protein